MATIEGIGLAEPSTVTKSLAAVKIDRGGSTTWQELMILASPNSTTSLALAEVMGSAPASTVVGLAVRVVSGPSSVADLAVRAVLSSTTADNPVTATLASTGNTVTARMTTSSGGSVEGSTTTPVTGALGLHVRSLPAALTTLNSTAGTDSVVTLVSSNAASKAFVSAYTVNSTVAGPVNCGFYSGATLVWPVTIWASGGMMKDAQAVAAPGYLFAGSTGAALTFNVASTGAYRVAITYWTGA